MMKLALNQPHAFNLGEVALTKAVRDAVPEEEILKAVERFARRDWGEVDDVHRKNDDRTCVRGIAHGMYEHGGTEFWILMSDGTTTVMLPEEY